MRLLADENFPKLIVEALRRDGHDALWARSDLGGTSDVFRRAETTDRRRPQGSRSSRDKRNALAVTGEF
ncbi:MAG: DUF5615 family PIN-like protein [Bryobacterales bacterium]|nr:DUF5615 family PIN-like protein [Bryobacterales bacterium]